jgi:hypothetical protein
MLGKLRVTQNIRATIDGDKLIWLLHSLKEWLYPRGVVELKVSR